MDNDIYRKIMQDEYSRGQRMAGQGGTAQICPEIRAERCRLCELCREVFKSEKRKDSPLREKAVQYNQKKKYYSNIIFPAINPMEIKLFEYGEKIFRKLLNAHMDALSEYKNFFHQEQGRNLYIIKYPAPQKKNTDYGVEFRIQATSLQQLCGPNYREQILMRMYDLNSIPTLLSQGIVPFRQGELLDGRNEVRILPSWVGIDNPMFFNIMKYHFLPKDEFDAIQSGRLNPFTPEAIIVSQPRNEILPNLGRNEAVIQPPVKSPWATYETQTMSQSMVKPPCFGTYDETSPLCKEKCDPNIPKECIMETHKRTAARLYQK